MPETSTKVLPDSNQPGLPNLVPSESPNTQPSPAEAWSPGSSGSSGSFWSNRTTETRLSSIPSILESPSEDVPKCPPQGGHMQEAAVPLLMAVNHKNELSPEQIPLPTSTRPSPMPSPLLVAQKDALPTLDLTNDHHALGIMMDPSQVLTNTKEKQTNETVESSSQVAKAETDTLSTKELGRGENSDVKISPSKIQHYDGQNINIANELSEAGMGTQMMEKIRK
jgi:hypothetical protein